MEIFYIDICIRIDTALQKNNKEHRLYSFVNEWSTYYFPRQFHGICSYVLSLNSFILNLLAIVGMKSQEKVASEKTSFSWSWSSHWWILVQN